MNHSLFGGLATAVLLSTVGAQLPCQAQENTESLQPSQSLLSSSAFADESASVTSGTSASSGASISEQVEPEATSTEMNSDTADATASGNQVFENADILAHSLEERQAATVYLRSLPVITFVGSEQPTDGGSKELHAATDGESAVVNPTVEASELLSYLQELDASSDATEIGARWDEEQEAFIVFWADQDLVIVGDRAILPDTTENPAEDALQIANRLRRLVGNASGLTEVEGMPEPPEPPAPTYRVASSMTGMASWYGPGFHGRRSASGEVFNRHALTAAHRTLPFGTRVRVTNVTTGQQVVVRINDRGPFSHNRIIDLSEGAAANIGIRRSGVGQVRLEVLAN
jgi:rare lipoprotein A